jgi:hypothetical protein
LWNDCSRTEDREPCKPETGCCVAVRWNPPWPPPLYYTDEDFEDPDYNEEHDSPYEYKSADDDDPVEYDSNASVDPDHEDEDHVSEEDEMDLEDAANLDFLRRPGVIEVGCKDVFIPPPAVEGLNEVPGYHFHDEAFELEHIAGPGCTDGRGYNGHNISVEETRGCSTFQCLAHKSHSLRPEADDEEFELHSDYFLTGIHNKMPARDEHWPCVIPSRHGVDAILTDVFVESHTNPLPATVVSQPKHHKSWKTLFADAHVIFDGQAQLNEIAMPFHPTCFEAMKYAMRLYLGRVDITGLMGWRNLESHQLKVYEDFPHHPLTKENGNKFWFHSLGSEWLYANPVWIPALTPLFRSAIREEPSFNTKNGAFAVDPISKSNPRSHPLSASQTQDPFQTLPQELIESITGHLSSPDISNLRLASRAFTQLPISLWYHLIRAEMPWLWEAWSDEMPSKWAAVSAADLRREKEEHYKFFDDDHERSVIREEMPEILNAWIKKDELHYTNLGVDKRARVSLETYVRLPRAKTNWYQLYSDITRNWGSLKGLWNRKRIWNDCEEIIRRIQKYREEGRFNGSGDRMETT